MHTNDAASQPSDARVTQRAHQGYTAFMRLLGYALILCAFIAILASNSSDAHAGTGASLRETRDIPHQMMDAHHCWSGPAPADMRGQIPGHAVVTINARRGPQYVSSQIGFDIWLHGHPGTLYGFCR